MCSDKIFRGITQTPSPTSAGPCDMPILYRDASFLGLFYRVPVARAQALMEGLPFEVFPIFGKALVLLISFEYRDTTVGSYGELGLAIQCKRRGTRPGLAKFLFGMKSQEETGLYVVNLPVTTEPARAAGVELWGYPKYVTTMETDFSAPDRCRIRLGDELEITHRRGFGLKMKGLPFITWTVKDGRMLRTVIPVGHRVRYGGASSVAIEVLGDGPTAKTVRALGLDATKASYAFRTDAMRAVLPHGVDMGPVPDAMVANADAA